MASKLFPHTHQHNSMDCGPACLRMVAQAYGKHYRLETLRERCFITREGVSMLGIADAAETIGFRTLGVKTTVKELTSDMPVGVFNNSRLRCMRIASRDGRVCRWR